MNSRINAVVAALVTIAEETEDDGSYYKVTTVNRWLASLPGGLEKWSHLILEEEFNGEVPSYEFLTHVKAMIAFLENLDEDFDKDFDEGNQPIEGEILDPAPGRFKLLR